MDTVDNRATDAWFDNLEEVFGGKAPDYLVVSHLAVSSTHLFMSNANDNRLITAQQEETASALSDGIMEYLNSRT